MAETTIMRRGDLAYVETVFNGLIPVKILDQAAHRTATRTVDGVKVKVTAERGAYRRGEVMTVEEQAVIPRSHVFRRGGNLYVRGRSYLIKWND